MRRFLSVAGLLAAGLGTIWIFSSTSNEQSPTRPEPTHVKVGDDEAGQQRLASSDHKADGTTADEPSPPPSRQADVAPGTPIPHITSVPKSEAQRESLLMGFLQPQSEAIANSLVDTYNEILAGIADGPAMSEPHTQTLAWDLARSKVGWQVAINRQIQEYVRGGKDMPATPNESDGKNYVAVGKLSWGTNSRMVWGPQGAVIEIPFAFTLEDHPLLASAWEQYRSSAREFSAVVANNKK